MLEKFLPVGTVVKLKDGEKKVMITGFLQESPLHKLRIYDYCGCLYPEGTNNIKDNLYFDHKDIINLCFLGYRDLEETEYKQKLEEYIEKSTFKIVED